MTQSPDAPAIFAPLWKRKWLILLVGVVVGVATYLYYQHQEPEYRASTGIYLGGGSELQALLGEGEGNAVSNDRNISNQLVLINSTVVGSAVEKKLLKEGNLAAASGSAEASAAEGSDFIVISSTANTGQGAADLANTYATVYLRLREHSYRKNIRVALDSTEEQLQTVESASSESEQSLQIQNLVDRTNRLRSQLSLGDAGDRQINPAAPSATPVAPKPKRNAIFGFVLGLVLAGLVAYALSRFDRRLRSLADIETIFEAPVLAAVPSIRRPIAYAEGQPVPAAALREPLRRLHTTLQLPSATRQIDQPSPRTILMISADAGDGKSTLVAGLALVQSEAGERVAIVESDLRRPVQGELLGVDGSRGLAEVLAGVLTTREATQTLPSTPPPSSATTAAAEKEGVATALRSRPLGSVSVLPSGGTVANPPALLAGRAMPTLLNSISEEFDYVLVDAPPALEVSDVLPLLPTVDAIVIVARVGHTGQTSARRLVDLLSRAPHAPVVGIVANDASAADMEAFGLSLMDYGESRALPKRG